MFLEWRHAFCPKVTPGKNFDFHCPMRVKFQFCGFLLDSTIWKPWRTYMYEVYGYKTTTLLFAVLINLFLFLLWLFRRLQNEIEALFHVRKSPYLGNVNDSTDIQSKKVIFLALIENVIEVNNESRLFPKPETGRKWAKAVSGIFLAQILYGSIVWCRVRNH